MRVCVLAGGKSTRLPNKLMLTTRDGEPLVASSLGLALSAVTSQDRIDIIVPPKQSVIATYLKKKGFVHNCKPTEPSSVLQILRDRYKDCQEQLLVLFGDCWNYKTLSPLPLVGSVTVTRVGHHQLDGWCDKDKRWVDRSCKPSYKFVGAIRAKPEQLQMLVYAEDLMHWLNIADFNACVLQKPIFDLGTQKSYEDHWHGNHPS